MVSAIPNSLKVTSLKTFPTVGMVGRTYILRTGEGGQEPPVAWVQLSGQSEVTSSQLLLSTITEAEGSATGI